MLVNQLATNLSLSNRPLLFIFTTLSLVVTGSTQIGYTVHIQTIYGHSSVPVAFDWQQGATLGRRSSPSAKARRLDGSLDVPGQAKWL